MALHLLLIACFVSRNGMVDRKPRKNGGHHRKKMICTVEKRRWFQHSGKPQQGEQYIHTRNQSLDHLQLDCFCSRTKPMET